MLYIVRNFNAGIPVFAVAIASVGRRLHTQTHVRNIVEDPSALCRSESHTVIGWDFGFANEPKMYHKG
jgi:hypothetical protein